MAISALPPFNGFFSEWITFQSLFYGIMKSNISVRWIFILTARSLAFTGGLAAMCFVKVCGATFLTRPRSEEVHHAKEANITLRVGMTALATLSLTIGITAETITNILTGIVTDFSVFYSSLNQRIMQHRLQLGRKIILLQFQCLSYSSLLY